jgi:hypothetical protein
MIIKLTRKDVIWLLDTALPNIPMEAYMAPTNRSPTYPHRIAPISGLVPTKRRVIK